MKRGSRFHEKGWTNESQDMFTERLKMADLNAVHKSPESPWGITKARNPEKWGVQIQDEEIAAFFKIIREEDEATLHES